MNRLDTTSAEHQAAYPGRHTAGEGRWTYPSQHGGRIRKGTRYLRCGCGWRLVNVPETAAGRGKAQRAYSAHVLERQAARAAAG